MARSGFRALVLFWSQTGNTRRVAYALYDALRALSLPADIVEMGQDVEVDCFDYELVLLGAPVHQWLPPEPVMRFLKRQRRRRARVAPAAPERPGRFGVVFCTYAGRHTGVGEAVPALKYMGQFLEHAGIRVVEEWPVVGQLNDPARREMNVSGRLGDIRGRPNEADLKDVCGRLHGLLRRLGQKLPGLPGQP